MIEMYIGLHVKSSCQILMKLEFSRGIFEKFLNIEFSENLSSWSRVCRCGRTDRQTDMRKLIVAFRNLANATKKRRWVGMFSWWTLPITSRNSWEVKLYTNERFIPMLWCVGMLFVIYHSKFLLDKVWTMGFFLARTVAKLNSTEMDFWRRLARISRKDKIRNTVTKQKNECRKVSFRRY
jgi:hypothetical protein